MQVSCAGAKQLAWQDQQLMRGAQHRVPAVAGSDLGPATFVHNCGFTSQYHRKINTVEGNYFAL